jgi:Tol biopolymer transport system component
VLGLSVVAVIAVGPRAADATYPGTNGLIVFGAETKNGYELYTVRPNGEGMTRITHVRGDAIHPDWSPDGRQIVFELDDQEGPVFCSIQLMNADGTGMTDLTTSGNPEGWTGCEGQPSFTPDGSRIVFGRYDDATDIEALWSMDLTGGDRVEVTRRGAVDANVSPDRTQVSFLMFNGEELGQALAVADIDGTELHRLTRFSADVATKHDWAPSGRRIAFTVNADRFEEPADIATIRPDGTGLRYLTRFDGPARRAYVGSYSPDGAWIVYRLEVGERYGLYRMHPNGTGRREILPLSSFRPRYIDWGAATG